MQNILSIDATCDPALACIVRCNLAENKDPLAQSDTLAVELEVLEQHELVLTSKINSTETGVSTSEVSTTPTEPSQPLLERFTNNFSSVVMVVRPSSFAALNLSTPISDPKALSRILELEVQDLVPFDVSEFALAHRVVEGVAEDSSSSPADGRGFDVHVGMMPKNELASILKSVEAQGVSPVLVNSAPSVLALVHRIATTPMASNAAILRAEFSTLPVAPSLEIPPEENAVAVETTQPVIAVEFVAVIGGVPRSERVFVSPNHDEEKALEQLVAQIRLTLLAIEHQSNINFEALYVVPGSSGPDPQRFAEILQRTLSAGALNHSDDSLAVYPLPSSGLVPDNPTEINSRNAMAALGAIFGHDIATKQRHSIGKGRTTTQLLQPLTNFRVKQFAPRPPFRELWRGIRALLPFIFGALAVTVMVVTFSYLVKEQRLASLQRSLHDQISTVLPDFSSEPGKEVGAIENASLELSRQLKDLISPFSMSPLETLLEVSRDIPAGRGIIVRSIDIKGTNLKITGNAPDYGAIDDLEKSFKARRKIYRRPKVNNTGSGSRRDFTLEATLGDDTSNSKSDQEVAAP